MSHASLCRLCSFAWLLLAAPIVIHAQDGGVPMRVLHSSAGHDAEKSTSGEAYADATEVIAAWRMRLGAANPALGGDVTLEFSADNGTGPHTTHMLIRVPLSGTAAASAETRTCSVGSRGQPVLLYDAARNPKEFVAFQPAAAATDFEVPLNQYLCRALAAPFPCGGGALPVWSRWKLARTARLVLQSGAPATLELSPVAIIATDRPFDRAQCEGPARMHP